MLGRKHPTTKVVVALAVLFLAVCVAAPLLANVSVDPSGRYYRDSNGKPIFLVGYYAWSATVDGYYIDHPSRYDDMMSQGSPYKMNYIRMVLGGNKLDCCSSPPAYNGQQAPVPWVLVNGRADLNQWNPAFWNGVKAQCQFAKANGYIIHFDFFDGVSLRDQGGAAYGYNGSFWNPVNQTAAFYPAGDYRDLPGRFYRLNEFNTNTGIGYYQRALIDKGCAELAPYDNVFFEVGNELLGSDCNWNTAVINYIKTKTSKPITVVGTDCSGIQGFSMHDAADLPSLKAEIAAHVGRGYPVWEDTDGSYLGRLGPDDQRRGVWYSFASGAGAYGGFTCDFWTWPVSPPPGFNTTRAIYMKNLMDFITQTSIPFATMAPQVTLVSNTSENCCIANQGSHYLAYILNDSSATVDLTSVSGNAYYKLYDPRAGTFSGQSTVAGGAVRSFNKPGGADDWVIYIYTTLPSHGQLNVKAAGSYTIDGNPNDWNFGNYFSMAYAGGSGPGDIALTGYDAGALYFASYAGVLPTSAADHTAKVYASHDSSYEYFLIRCDDNDMRYSVGSSANWQNDCVEIYIDPSNDGGSSGISNSSSDIQLVIDANNQKNVYCCTSGYTTQVLNGVTSAVVRDGSGWWLEARISKAALDPDLPQSGMFGLDFNFRDNDNNNDAALTTVYTWNDASGSGFPSKIPDNWGDAFQIAPGETPYGGSPAILPGIIQAENYDNGGEGIAYHDTTSGNAGGQYRSNDVDIETCGDTGGGYDVGWMEPGEWLNYMVYVNTTRAYDLNLRVAGGGGAIHINIDGQNVTGSRNTPNTGSWTNWATYTIPSIQLTAGYHVLTLVVEASGLNLNYIEVAVPPVYWNTLGTLRNVGAGQTPCVCTDSAGNIHVAYVAGNGVTYKKYNSSWSLQVNENITSPTGGAYWMNMCLDSNANPHIVFSESVSEGLPYATYAFYTNRIGGSWKSPITAVNLYGTGNSIWRHKVGVYGSSYAYIGYEYGYNQALVGRIDRIVNLSSSPSVDRTVNTPVRSVVAVRQSDGAVFAFGRTVLNSSYQQYDYNLNAQGGLVNMTSGTGKAGAPAAAFMDKYNILHTVSWNILAGGSGVCADRCGLVYCHGQRIGSPFTGMLGGAGGTGPTGNEPTGWWNDDVAPALCRDSNNMVYIAWRGWTASGEGRVGYMHPDAGFVTQNCSSNLICGGTTCTGSQFCQTITRRRWQNCEIAPAPSGGGVYISYESGGQCYIQPVGVGEVIDTTPPGNVTGFTCRAEQSMNELTWTNPGDADFTGVKIVWKTTGYPSSTFDGYTCYDGPSTAYTHSGLTNGTTYYYKAYAHDNSLNYASGAQASGTPTVDTTAPGNVTSFTATAGNAQVSLSWTNPSATDLYGVKILFKTTTYPTGPNDASADVCFNGMGSSYVHGGLTNGVAYYYRAYAYDEVPNYASGAQATTTPYDPQTPYSGVINLPGIIQAENYDNGGEGIAYHDTTSGNSGATYRSDDVDIGSCTDTGGGYCIGWTIAGEWLEYKVNVTATGDYSIGVRVALNTGTAGYRILIDGVDVTGARNFAATGDWQNWTTIITPSVYMTAGPHVLQLYVDSGTPNINYIVVESRGPDAIGIDLGVTNVEDGLNYVSGVGDGDTVGWTAAGHNFRENLDYPDYYMYFNVADNWAYQGSKQDVYITMDYYDIGTNSLSLNYDSTSSSYQSVSGPTLTNTLTFKSYTWHVTNAYFGNRQNGGADFRIAVSAQQEWGLDTIAVYTAPADTTPPANVTNFTASAVPAGQQLNLSWTNPTDPDFAGVLIRFKTTGYPTSTSDGTQIYNSNGTSYNHTGLTNGVIYYYKAFAYDGVPNYASGAQASGIPADTTPPGNVTSFTATSGDMQVSLSWTNPGDADYAGVKIVWKTGGYPTAHNDASATQCYNSNGTSYVHTGLTNTVAYYYKAYARDGVPNYASGAQATATPADVTPPANVTSFSATSGDNQVVLSWIKPTDSDLAGVKVMFKTTGYPTGAADGTQVYSGMNQGVTHTGLTNGVTYYYKAFAYDEVPNYASGAQASAVPADVTPPGNVTSFSASPGNQQNILTWTNPVDADFAGVKIMFKTTGYPTGPTDGTQCYSGTAATTTHTGLTNGVTYYYKAFAFDEVPNYASGAQTSGLPFGTLTINTKSSANINLVIDANSTDWNIASNFTTKARGGMSEQGDYAIVGYDGGNLYYGGYWTGAVLPTSATDHTAKIYSFHDHQYLYFLVRCDDSDMQYSQPSSMNWANDCIEFYIDPSHDHGSSPMSSSTSDVQLVLDANNQKNVYMTTSGYATQVLNGVTSAVVRDGSGWWMECKISKTALDPDLANSGTFGLDFMCRDNDNNNDISVSSAYIWRDPTSGAGFPSKVPDNWGHSSLAALSADTTAPAAVTGFSATPGQLQNSLSWTNPGTSDWAGTQIRFKTTGYPTGPADGTQIYNSTGTSYNHTGLTSGVTYYYCAYAYDEVPNYATAAQTSGVAQGQVTISNSTFDSDANGWSINTWRAHSAYGYGTMTWTSGIGNGGGAMRCSGAGSTDSTDRCTREGAEIYKTISTVGYSNIKVQYDLKVNSLGGNYTGAGTGSCIGAVDHALIDEQITVSYSTNGGSSWTEAEYLTRSTLTGSYQSWGTRTIDLTSVSACNNNANFAVKLRWQVNTSSDTADLDNIKVTSN